MVLRQNEIREKVIILLQDYNITEVSRLTNVPKFTITERNTMRVKNKHKNKYILSSLENKLWIRDFTKSGIQQYIDINNLIRPSDFSIILENERINTFLSSPNLEPIENIQQEHPNCIIVSSGYKFEEKQNVLSKLLYDEVSIFGVNLTLAKWNLKLGRAMNYFVTNNPYKDCLLQIPTKHRYVPACIASNRTYHEFFKRYKGYIYKYYPTTQEDYTGISRTSDYKVDDYRNPICAAINLAYKFGVKKLLLLCCDESFENERPGAIRLQNGLWTYPQQIMAHELIDGNIYWLINNQQERKIEVRNHSSGPNYKNAPYINEEDIYNFFKEVN